MSECYASILEASAVYPVVEIELIIVDNAPEPGGEFVLPERRASMPSGTAGSWRGDRVEASVIQLARPGLSAARNVGLAACTGSVIVLIDDDCRLRKDYFKALDNVVSNYPDGHEGKALLLLGGRVELGDPLDLPFTIRPLDEREVYRRDVHPGGFVPGCNCVMTRATLERLGGFDEYLGAGTPLRSGEDTDYLIRAVEAGVTVECLPQIVVRHYHGRRSHDEVAKLHYGYAFGNGALYVKYRRTAPWLAKHFYWTLRSAVRERFGGPSFDTRNKLTYQSTLRGNISGAGAYIKERLTGASRSKVTLPKGYRPQIDSIRAVAAGFVLLSHLWLNSTEFGHLGIRAFFVLSGFLITAQLIERPRLTDFYWRRAARLLPAFFLALGLALFLDSTGARQWWQFHFAQITNFLVYRLGDWGPVWPIGHFWTLNVEAQFYVAWPLIFLFLPRSYQILAVLGLILAAVAFRVVALAAGFDSFINVLPPASFDALGMGALMTLMPLPLLLRAGILLSPTLAGVALLPAVLDAPWLWQLCETLSIIPLGALVIAATRNELPLPKGTLLPALGRISYGIYLYHMILWGWIATRFDLEPSLFVLLGVGGLTVAVAWFSHRLIEKPLQKALVRAGSVRKKYS
ncbi:putative acyltransferase [Wenxinia marina DSM 24838]|uniref:Putative acyltransferase n=2 Tax=Wenxinia TaxID=653686 RepID=A0A0D0PCY2_9RHOB|nr:putative acyltransferase [Wenxinia marina DSM 24838]